MIYSIRFYLSENKRLKGGKTISFTIIKNIFNITIIVTKLSFQ